MDTLESLLFESKNKVASTLFDYVKPSYSSLTNPDEKELFAKQVANKFFEEQYNSSSREKMKKDLKKLNSFTSFDLKQYSHDNSLSITQLYYFSHYFAVVREHLIITLQDSLGIPRDTTILQNPLEIKVENMGRTYESPQPKDSGRSYGTLFE